MRLREATAGYRSTADGLIAGGAATIAAVVASAGVVVAPTLAVSCAAVVAGLSLLVVGAWPPLVALLSVRMYGDVSGSVGHYADLVVGALAVAVVVLALVVPVSGRVRTTLVAVYVLLAASTFFASTRYGDLSWFVREWLRLASMCAIGVLALSAAQTVGSIERYLRIAVMTAGVPALIALAQFAGVGHLSPGARAFATFSHPNAAGAVFTFALLGSLALALHTRRRADWYLVVLFCAAIFTTRSLGALAAAVIGVYALTHFRLQGVKRGLLLAGIVGAVAIFALTPIGAERLSQLESTTSYSAAAQGHVTNSLDWRFLNWHLLLGVWGQHQLFGTGASTTQQFVQPLGTLPHNEYVRVLVEGGVVGALVVAAGLLGLWRAVRRRASSSLVGSLGRAVLIAACVDALVDNLFNYTPAVYLAAVAIGLALGAPQREEPTWMPTA